MKNLLYFAQWNHSPSNGISNKIDAQVDGLRELYNTDLCLVEDNKVTLNQKTIDYSDNSFFGKFRKYFRIINIIKEGDYDYLYSRNVRGISALPFLLFVLYAKKRKLKTILEIPTYPFYSEFEVNNFFASLTEKFCRFFYKYIFNAVSYMGEKHDEIWGIKAIRLENGVNVENLPPKIDSHKGTGINLIGVGSLDYWHGYDRLILGMKGVDDVSFHIVGEGREKVNLMELVRKNNLENNIFFHGKKFGSELNELFDKSDLAIDSLGRHRSGIKYNSSIKSKEYAARGLPFILAHDDDSFQDTDFVFKLPSNDQPINLSEVIKWYDHIGSTGADIRQFALNNLVWSKQFAKIKSIFPTDC